VTVTIAGNARDIVRYAKLRGLLCVARTAPAEVPCGATLEISGPLALFHRTRVYGSALASLVPRLSWCDHFELSAECLLAGETRALRVRSGDPIFPAERPQRFDSALERRFARDFARAAPDWELIREPAAVQVGHRLIFPDFGLVHRRDPMRQALLEIVGFWSPAYRAEKLEHLREAHIDSLILCIDEKHAFTADEMPAGARVVRYRRRIRAEAVLELLEA
jgi:predicted nuclease of restriction endonuclease-like RecB superfamily